MMSLLVSSRNPYLHVVQTMWWRIQICAKDKKAELWKFVVLTASVLQGHLHLLVSQHPVARRGLPRKEDCRAKRIAVKRGLHTNYS